MGGHLTNQAAGMFRSYGAQRVFGISESINISSRPDELCLTIITRLILLVIVLCFCGLSAVAQSTPAGPKPSPNPESKTDPRDPIERSDEFKSKLTFGIYFTNGAAAYDLNLRHQFGNLTAWIAGFYYP